MDVKHLMKEEEYMDKIIKVMLLEEGGIDYIRFFLDDENIENINLNSNEQNTLRNIYKKMISMSIDSKLSLQLEYQVGYNKILFKEIADEFIKDLNGELEKIHNDTTLPDLQEEELVSVV